VGEEKSQSGWQLQFMSKIGKQPIKILENVDIQIKDQRILVKGPKGTLEKVFPSEISVERKNGELLVKFKGSKEKKALWGTWRQIIKNMIEGVSKGFEKRLKLEGIGWRANIEGKDLVLKVGFSHPVRISPIEGVSFSVEKDIIKVSGIDKEKVGIAAANIRKVRPPEPYKGKGIRYIDEVIRRKPGKKAVGTK